MELTGKTAVVTGASSGIGRAAARALAGEGMQVVAVARRKERLDELADEVPGVLPYPADVTSDEEVAELAAWVREELGACHVLVNSAGASGGARFRAPEHADEVFRLVDLNFGGIVRCMAAFADLLFASAPSRVVNVGSVAGKLGVGPPGYAASKFATVGLTESLAGQWGRRGVAVSQLNPGYVETEGFPMDWLKRLRLGRFLVRQPDDIAGAVIDVARKGTLERTVPRWYWPLVPIRHLCGPLYRRLLRRL